MKEYTITMSFSIESECNDVDRITKLAEEFSQKVMNDNNIVRDDDFEIVDVNIDEIQDHNDYDCFNSNGDGGYDDDFDDY